MENRISDEMKIWLFDVANGNLTDEAVLARRSIWRQINS